MQLTTKITGALAAAVLSSGAVSAQALDPNDAEAWGSIGNFQIGVIDLDLNDGITASVTFDDDTRASGTSSYTQPSSDPSTSRYDFGLLFGASSSSGQFGFNRAGSSTSAGDPFLPGMGPGATAYSKVVEAFTFSEAAGAVLGGYFSLTANTRLVLSADAIEVGASVSRPGTYAHASATVLLSGVNGNDLSADGSYVFVRDGGVEIKGPTHITAQFNNVSGNAARGRASASVFVFSQGAIPAIPEPETYFLAMVGLLFVGACVRRQNPR